MGFISTGISAIGKLIAVGLLLIAFVAGLAGVVYMSLSGNEIKVPEIVGKDFVESEKELAALGLKIKRRADRPSTEKINTVLEQLPKPGETVKTGQLILVVVSREGATAETPKSLIKDIEDDDTKKIEEMISDKPKRSKAASNSNSNAKAKADKTRDTIANTSMGSNSALQKTDGTGENADKDKKETGTDKGKTDGGTDQPAKPPATPKPAAKPPSGEQRPRTSRP